jgi:hypothetical protein
LKVITIFFLHSSVIDAICIVAVVRAMNLAYPHCSSVSLPRPRVALKLDLDDTTHETQVAAPGCAASWNEAFDMYVANSLYTVPASVQLNFLGRYIEDLRCNCAF